MKSSYCLFAVLILISACKRPGNTSSEQSTQNVLTEREKEEGWKLLYDGKTAYGWRGIYQETFPAEGWDVQNNVLTCLGSGSGRGGDIITAEQYSDFELSLEFKIPEKANSGVKYFVTESLPETPGHGLGLEYQLLDDANFHYPERGEYRSLSSLYDLIPAENKKTKPLNEWNLARIIVRGTHVEHWLNGNKVVEFERGSKEFRTLVAGSKYKNIEKFGEAPKGHILLQDEGTPVSFRNIKIKLF